MDNISLIAIDLAKQSFHVRAVNHRGRAIRDKKVSREKLLEEILQSPSNCTVAMEACGSAHYWGRRFQEHGYKVRLIAPQFVKPYVKSQKNDRADAEAIAEASSRESMRFVALKTEEQQEVQAVHRVRSRVMKSLVAVGNEIRGLIGEYGYVVPQGICHLRKWLSSLEQTALSAPMKLLLSELYEELLVLESKIKLYDKRIKDLVKRIPPCKSLLSIPGIGPITATAIYAAIGNGSHFKNGRCFAASVGLVPRQFSTGGKSSLGRISKRGDRYLRQLLVQGARSVVKTSKRRTDKYTLWVDKLRTEKGFNKASVALANRNARIAWALLSKPDSSFSCNHQHLH